MARWSMHTTRGNCRDRWRRPGRVSQRFSTTTTPSAPIRATPAAVGLPPSRLPSCRCARVFPLESIRTGGSRPTTSGVLPAEYEPMDRCCPDDREYYVGSRYAGREVVAQLDATPRQVRVLDQQAVLKVKPLCGLVGEERPLEAFICWCEREA